MKLSHNSRFAIFGMFLLFGSMFFLMMVPAKPIKKPIEETPRQTRSQLGFIRSVHLESGTIDFDSAKWLAGAEGEEAAIRAGVCDEQHRGECLPNDYFIENTSTTTESMSLDKNVQIVLKTYRIEETGQVADHAVPLAEFNDLIASSSVPWNKLPYTIKVTDDNTIIRIDEVYVP